VSTQTMYVYIKFRQVLCLPPLPSKSFYSHLLIDCLEENGTFKCTVRVGFLSKSQKVYRLNIILGSQGM